MDLEDLPRTETFSEQMFSLVYCIVAMDRHKLSDHISHMYPHFCHDVIMHDQK